MSQSLPIRIESLVKRYDDFVALDGVSVDIRPGEFLTLLGPSGSGKTTVLMAIAGFTRPDSGRIVIGERDVVSLPPNKRDIGVVFQNYALFPHMSVLENVMYPLALRRVAKPVARERARDALAMVQLEEQSERPVTALSGGQKQRVALARAMVYRPAVMLMDEPLSALDKNLREQMQYEIRRLHEVLKITTIYVTHDQREALTMSDRIAVMNRGRIEQIDAPQTVYLRPRTHFVAEFMGEANVLPATAAIYESAPPEPGATIMVRAEHLRLVVDAGEAARHPVRIDGRLVSKVFRGENWLARLDCGEGREILLNLPALDSGPASQLSPGDPCCAVAAREQVHVFASGERP